MLLLFTPPADIYAITLRAADVIYAAYARCHVTLRYRHD